MGDTFGDGEGDEKPVHEVCLDDFYIGKYEVTQKEWQEVMGNNPSYFKGCDNCPVEQVSWDDVQEYIGRLNQKLAPAGSKQGYRLPTEAEWEYAARSGGKMEKYAGGDNVHLIAWYKLNSVDKTHPVGQKKPNGFGLYDMSGNVWEWVQDVYISSAYIKHSRNNPIYEGSGSTRVIRGGSCYREPKDMRTTFRYDNSPSDRNGLLGFRLMRTN